MSEQTLVKLEELDLPDPTYALAYTPAHMNWEYQNALEGLRILRSRRYQTPVFVGSFAIFFVCKLLIPFFETSRVLEGFCVWVGILAFVVGLIFLCRRIGFFVDGDPDREWCKKIVSSRYYKYVHDVWRTLKALNHHVANWNIYVDGRKSGVVSQDPAEANRYHQLVMSLERAREVLRSAEHVGKMLTQHSHETRDGFDILESVQTTLPTMVEAHRELTAVLDADAELEAALEQKTPSSSRRALHLVQDAEKKAPARQGTTPPKHKQS